MELRGNKKAGDKRRLSCWADRGLLLLFLRGLLLLRSHWKLHGLELNAGPIPRWTGRLQSDVRHPIGSARRTSALTA